MQAAIHRAETFAVKEQLIRIVKSQVEAVEREREVREGLKTMYGELLELSRQIRHGLLGLKGDFRTLLHEHLSSTSSTPLYTTTPSSISSSSPSSSYTVPPPSGSDGSTPSCTSPTPSTDTNNASIALITMARVAPATPPVPEKTGSEPGDKTTNSSSPPPNQSHKTVNEQKGRLDVSGNQRPIPKQWLAIFPPPTHWKEMHNFPSRSHSVPIYKDH